MEQPVDGRGGPARAVLHNYARDTRLFNQRTLEEMQFEYIRTGFHPGVGQRSLPGLRLHHACRSGPRRPPTAKPGVIGEYEPALGEVLAQRRQGGSPALPVLPHRVRRDPAARSRPGAAFRLVHPARHRHAGHTMPDFRDIADVIRRSGIYGPRDYLKIVQEQIRYWKIESLRGSTSWGARRRKRSWESRPG